MGLKYYIITGMNLFIPTVRLRARQFPAWFTPQLRHLLKCYRTRQRKYNQHPTPNNLQRLGRAQCSFHDANVASKTVFENDLIHGYAMRKDPKIFQYIKKFTKSDVLPTQLHDDSDLADTDFTKAELFNKYFFSVFTKSNCSEPNPDELNSMDNSLDPIHFTVSDVFQALVKLNPNKAGGIDNITPTILRNCASALAAPLHHLFITSINNGIIPTEWKIHKIVPIYKSGDKMSVINYRPISLLCNVSKVLEGLIYDRVISTMAGSIIPCQFGFQRNTSTQQQLLIYFHQLVTSLAETDTVYIDFQKAFDSVPHNELLLKLWNIGITGSLWKWFRSYLNNRSQCVSVNNSLSNCLPVLSGVPQLFLVYINDLPSVLEMCQLLIFADDTKCFKQIHSMSDTYLMQDDLNSLLRWSIDNHLHFNVSKFVFIRFHPKFNTEYNIDGFNIPYSSVCKDLGIIFSNDLSWN